MGVAALEAEDEAFQATDAKRVEAGEVGGERMEAVAGQGQVLEAGGLVDIGQGGGDAAAESGMDLAVVVEAESAFKALVGKGADGHNSGAAAGQEARERSGS